MVCYTFTEVNKVDDKEYMKLFKEISKQTLKKQKSVKRKDTIKKSILIPITVSVLTALILAILKWLFLLIEQ